ncbi:MAG: deaminase [Eubacteriales bacterium]|nr:deaminase [Eubacteriales bacterium]
MYVTHFPCFTCAKLLVQLGVQRIVFAEGYPDEFSGDLLKEAGVEVLPY